MKKRSILIRIFTVIVIFSLSLIMFVLAFWGIFINQPNQMYAHLHLIITFVILVVVGSLVVSFLIRKILKPLSILNEAVEKAGKGNLDQQLEIKSRDEFGALASAFNKMTAELKKMIVSREQLLSDVSHELRSPITRAWLALEMMPDSAEKDSLAGDLKEMESMITGILESERLRNGTITANPERIQLSSLLAGLMKQYKHENERIRLLPVSDDLFINADETLIMTLFRNLVDNALKYSAGQPIPVEITVTQRERSIIISIEDYGPGIPEDKLPFIFEPFYRADQSRSRTTGGYGLGLHLCKRIADLHGAEIRLENKKDGKGLVAYIVF